MRILLLVAAAFMAAAPALAQTPEEKAKKVTRAAKQLTGPDVAIIKEAVNTIKLGGECMTVFTVGLDGKPKDIKPGCDPAAYDEWVVKAMASVTYTVELFLGEQFETEGMKQPFKFGAGAPAGAAPAGAAASAIKEPVVIKGIEPKELSRAINKIDEAGQCNAAFTVGIDGKPKDIVPNCTPDKYNQPIAEAISKTLYTPATKDGQPIEHKVNLPMNLSKPNG